MAQETGSYWTDIFSPEDLSQVTTLPPYVVNEPTIGGGSVFDMFASTGPGMTTGVIPSASDALVGGGVNVNALVGQGTVSTRPLAQPMAGDDIYTQIYNQELARRNAVRQSKGELPIAAYDTAEINQLADWAKSQVEAANQQQAAAQALAARNAAGGQLGIPLVLPLPIDPITGLLITGAGLIASGGNIATLDPNNPVKSLVGAAEGTIGTIAGIPGQIANVVSGTTASSSTTTTGGSGTNMGGEVGNTNTGGTIIVPPGAIGGNSGNTGTTPSDTGTPSTGGSTPIVGGGGGTTPATGTGTTGTGTQTQPSDNEFWNKVLGGVVSTQQTNQPPSQRIGGLTGEQPKDGTVTIFNPPTTNPPTTIKDPPLDNPPTKKPPVTIPPTDEPPTKKPPVNIPPVTTPPTTNPPSTSFPIIYGTQTSSYTPMATNVYQRNLPKELSQSTSALFGQIPLVDAQGQPTGGSTTLMGQYGDIYQNLLGQTMLGNAQQPGLTAQLGQQLTADQAKLQRIQSGQLAAEDVRNAQQAAREAYGARGQVMGQGAIGAEILNREAIRQQRENEARAAYQGSVQNALSATNLQTGNIFSPVGSLIGNTFNPLAPYEADVYGTNVNALNADQIAAANRQAALEAAKLGQTGTYAQALGTFLGSPQGQSTVSSFIDLLLGRGTTPRT